MAKQNGLTVKDEKVKTESLTSALRRHGIAVSERGAGMLKNSLICEFCRRSFRNNNGLSLHVSQCVLNPNRVIPSSTPCQKCGIQIVNRGLSGHMKRCNGNPADTIRRKAMHEDLLVRKAKAARTNKGFQSMKNGPFARDIKFTVDDDGFVETKVVPLKNKTVKASVTNEVGSAMPQADDSKSFDDLVAIMAEHLVPVLGRNYREFLTWVEDSRRLWDSV